MGFVLVKLEEPSAGEQFAFDQLTVTVGRADDCDLSVMDGSLSRQHASVSRGKDGRYGVKDLGSTNGSFVNDQKVMGSVALNNGDHLRFGAVRFKFLLMEEAAPSPEEQATRVDLSAPVPPTVATHAPPQRLVRSAVPMPARAVTRAIPAGASPDVREAEAPAQPSKAPSPARRVVGNVVAWVVALGVLGAIVVPLVRATADGSLDVKRWFVQENATVLPERAPTESAAVYCGRAYQPMLQICCERLGARFRGSVCDFGGQQAQFLACLGEEQAHGGCTGYAPPHGGGECGRCVAECEEQAQAGEGSPCRKLCRAEGYCG